MYEGAREATGQRLRMATNGASGALFPLVAGALVAVRFVEPTDDTNRSTAERDGQVYLRALLGLVSRRRVAAVVVTRALPVVVWIAFLTYNSLIVAHLLGGTAFQAGLLAAVGNVVFGVASSQAGRITSFFGSRFYQLLLGNVSLLVGMGAVLFAPGLATALVGITVAGDGFGSTLTLYRSVITGLAPPDLRGGLVSLAGGGGDIVCLLVARTLAGVSADSGEVVGE